MCLDTFLKECGSVPRAIQTQARLQPEAPAILAPGRRPLSYDGLWRQVRETIGSLRRLGIGPGDRVVLAMPNGPEMAIALVAAIAGAVAVPINPTLGIREFELSLEDLDAKAVLVLADSDCRIREVALARGLPVAELQSIAQAGAGVFQFRGQSESTPDFEISDGLPGFEDGDDGAALVLQSSGTTSRPKTFAFSQSVLLSRVIDMIRVSPRTSADRCLNLMPMFHMHGGVNAVLGSLAVGGGVICTPGLILPDFFRWLDDLRPTWYIGVPTMHQAIQAQAPNHRSSIARSAIRFIRSGSAALSPRLRSEVESTFGVPVLDAYGLTETGLMAYHPDPLRRKAGSVGKAVDSGVAVMDGDGRLLQRVARLLGAD
jgi:oxalate---CoA ligase